VFHLDRCPCRFFLLKILNCPPFLFVY
jgi:hypothetical protein